MKIRKAELVGSEWVFTFDVSAEPFTSNEFRQGDPVGRELRYAENALNEVNQTFAEDRTSLGG